MKSLHWKIATKYALILIGFKLVCALGHQLPISQLTVNQILYALFPLVFLIPQLKEASGISNKAIKTTVILFSAVSAIALFDRGLVPSIFLVENHYLLPLSFLVGFKEFFLRNKEHATLLDFMLLSVGFLTFYSFGLIPFAALFADIPIYKLPLDYIIKNFFVYLIEDFILALVTIHFYGLWKIFEKAGKPGYYAVIPGYNLIQFLKIVGKPISALILLCIPVINLFYFFSLNVDLAKRFGKSEKFGLGLFLLPFIFYPILGLDSNTKLEDKQGELSLSL